VRSELDRLMQERGLGGLVAIAHDRYSPALYYLTGQKLHVGVYFRSADGRAHLVADPMERDQAARAGCEFSTLPQHDFNRMAEAEGHQGRAYGRLIADVCASLGIRGRVSFHGDMSAGFAWAMLERMREQDPGIEVDTSQPDLLTIARATKDPDEIEMIRRSARGAVSAIERLRDYLAGLRREGDHFRSNGSGVVTLGDLRRLIHQEFAAHGLSEDGESIVSQGRDAGVPHNRGDDNEPLRAGTPLLVDIFPGEAGGGYHSDLTRTFCLGRAPDDLRRIYDDVHDAFRTSMDTLAVGAPCRDYQVRVCDLFAARGHATPLSSEGTQEGYVHGLGHGVGLSVHEAPRLGGPPSNTQTLEPGMVITVEPGLYYPSRGLGVRIEDLVLVREDGTFENLTPAPYDLEIEPRG
jgi:Xaa-Pro aminopeptidase